MLAWWMNIDAPVAAVLAAAHSGLETQQRGRPMLATSVLAPTPSIRQRSGPRCAVATHHGRALVVAA